MNTIWIYNSGQPFTDYDLTTNSSGYTNPSDPKTYTSLRGRQGIWRLQ